MSKGRLAVGVVVGAVAGVIAGLLTAPKSGKETRADLKKKADELKQQAVNRTDEVKEYAREKSADLRDKADDLKERGERAIQGARDGFNSK